jgi:hypothetical protein
MQSAGRDVHHRESLFGDGLSDLTGLRRLGDEGSGGSRGVFREKKRDCLSVRRPAVPTYSCRWPGFAASDRNATCFPSGDQATLPSSCVVPEGAAEMRRGTAAPLMAAV